MVRLHPLHETKKIYLELISKYKTSSSKKAFMSREIKQHSEFITAVEEAINRVNSLGNPCSSRHWLHGEMYFKSHLIHYYKELHLMHTIKNEVR